MKFLPILTISIAAIVITAIPAYANWQYTTWGMSLEEIMSNENSRAIRTSRKESSERSISVVGQALARTKYVASGTTFDVFFLFNQDKLTGVSLVPPSLDEALRINHKLGLIYGDPSEAIDEMEAGGGCRNIRRKWRSISDGNVVIFNAYFCIDVAPYDGVAAYNILYQPMLGTDQTGL